MGVCVNDIAICRWFTRHACSDNACCGRTLFAPYGEVCASCKQKRRELSFSPYSLSIKSIYRFYFSCGSTHKIEFAQQIHNSRGRVPRELYKGRKIVPVGRGFSSRFDCKRGFNREAARKTEFFDSLKGENFRSLLIYSKGIQSSSLTRASRYFLRSSKPDLPRSANIFFL